jgi:hypothetical protein
MPHKGTPDTLILKIIIHLSHLRVANVSLRQAFPTGPGLTRTHRTHPSLELAFFMVSKSNRNVLNIPVGCRLGALRGRRAASMIGSRRIPLDSENLLPACWNLLRAFHARDCRAMVGGDSGRGVLYHGGKHWWCDAFLLWNRSIMWGQHH